jgi:hypothetical protein
MASKRARTSLTLSAGSLSHVGAFAWPLIAECLDVDGWAILGNTCRGLRQTVVKIQEQTRKLRVVLDVASDSVDVSLNPTGKWWRLFNGFNLQDPHTTRDLILRLRSSLASLSIVLDEDFNDTETVNDDPQDAERWSMIQVALTTLAQAPGLLEFDLSRCFTADWFDTQPRVWLRDAMKQLILASGTSCRLQRLILSPCFNQAILPSATWKVQVCASLRSVTCSFAWLKFLTQSPASIRHRITSICLDDRFNGTSLAEAFVFCNAETFPALRRLQFAPPELQYMCFENGTTSIDIPADRLHEFPSYTNLPNLYKKHIGRFLTWPGLEWFCFQPTDRSAFRWDALRRRLDIYARNYRTRLDPVQANWLEWCRKDLPPHELCLVVNGSSIGMVPEQQVIDSVWIAQWWHAPPPIRRMTSVKSLIVGQSTFFEPDKELEIMEEVSWDLLHSLDADDVEYLSTCFPNLTSMTLSVAEADVFRQLPRRPIDSVFFERRDRRVESSEYRLKVQTAIQQLRSLEDVSIVIGTTTVWSAHKHSEWTWSSSIRVPVHLELDDMTKSKIEKVVDNWKRLLSKTTSDCYPFRDELTHNSSHTVLPSHQCVFHHTMMSFKHTRTSPSSPLAMGTLSRLGTFAWPLIAECLDVDGWAILGNTCRGLRKTVMKVQEQTRELCVVLDVAASGEDVLLNNNGKWWRLFHDFSHPHHSTKDLILRLRSSLTTLRMKMAEDDKKELVFRDNVSRWSLSVVRWSAIQVGLTAFVQAPGLLEFNLERFFTWDWLHHSNTPLAWFRDAMQQLILASGTSCRLRHLILNPCFNQAIQPLDHWKAQVFSSLRSVRCSFAWLKFLTKSPASIRNCITSICLDDDFTGTYLVEALAFCNVETFPALRRLQFAMPAGKRIRFENGEVSAWIPKNGLHEFPSYFNLPNLYTKHIGRILTWPGLEWFCFQPDDSSAFRWDALRRRLDIYARSAPFLLDAVQVHWLEWCRKDLPPHELRLVVNTPSIEVVQHPLPDRVWIGSWYARVRWTRIMDSVKSLIVGTATDFKPDEDFEIKEDVHGHALDADAIDCMSTVFPNITSLTLSISEADVFRRRLRRKQDPSLTWLKRMESDDYRLKLQTAVQRLRSLEHVSIVIGTATVWSGYKRTDWTWLSIQLPAHVENQVWFEEVVNDWRVLLS